MKVSLDGLMDEVEGGSRLALAGNRDGGDSLEPSLARFAPCSLGQASMDGHEANGSFRGIIGGRHFGVRDELEVFADMTVESLGEVVGRSLVLGATIVASPGDVVANRFQLSSEGDFGGEVVALVDCTKQLAAEFQQGLAMPTIGREMMVPHVFDVANQMSQAELQSHVLVELHVLAVGTRVSRTPEAR